MKQNDIIRYDNQKTDVDCGLVAVSNAIKWSGGDVDYNKFYKKHKNKADKEKGVKAMTMLKLLLESKSLAVTKIVTGLHEGIGGIEEVCDHLDNDGAILIRYFFNNVALTGHYALCIGRTKKSFKIANNTDTKPISYIKYDTMINNLFQKVSIIGADYYSIIWFLEKNNA